MFLNSGSEMNDRIESFDILKGIGVLLVIVGHTFMKEIGPFIQAFHMPLFFIVAGYFFKYKPLSEQMKKDFRRLIVPYFVVVLITALIASLKYYKSTHEINLFLSTLYECGTPAWFLLALFGAKQLFNIIYGYFENYYLLIVFVVSSIPCFISHFIDINPILSIAPSICGLLFYAIGYYVKISNSLHLLKRNSYIIMFVCLLLWLNTSILGAVDLHYCVFKLWIVDFSGACAGVYICYNLCVFIEKRTSIFKTFLLNVGYYSFIIYSFHAIEYVFPDWHQIASFSDGTVIRPFVILMFRLLFAWLAIRVTIRFSILRAVFFP